MLSITPSFLIRRYVSITLPLSYYATAYAILPAFAISHYASLSILRWYDCHTHIAARLSALAACCHWCLLRYILRHTLTLIRCCYLIIRRLATHYAAIIFGHIITPPPFITANTLAIIYYYSCRRHYAFRHTLSDASHLDAARYCYWFHATYASQTFSSLHAADTPPLPLRRWAISLRCHYADTWHCYALLFAIRYE